MIWIIFAAKASNSCFETKFSDNPKRPNNQKRKKNNISLAGDGLQQ
jgi:hypothetical protein